jgi:hypothetical protein
VPYVQIKVRNYLDFGDLLLNGSASNDRGSYGAIPVNAHMLFPVSIFASGFYGVRAVVSVVRRAARAGLSGPCERDTDCSRNWCNSGTLHVGDAADRLCGDCVFKLSASSGFRLGRQRELM